MAQCRAQFFDHTKCTEKSVCRQFPDGRNCKALQITQCTGTPVAGKEYCQQCIRVRKVLAIASPTLLEIVN